MSIKNLSPNPWDYPPAPGRHLSGTVRWATAYACFVILSDFFEGVLPIENALSTHADGERVLAQVISCNSLRLLIRLIILSARFRT